MPEQNVEDPVHLHYNMHIVGLPAERVHFLWSARDSIYKVQ